MSYRQPARRRFVCLMTAEHVPLSAFVDWDGVSDVDLEVTGSNLMLIANDLRCGNVLDLCALVLGEWRGPVVVSVKINVGTTPPGPLNEKDWFIAHVNPAIVSL
jgi:hypothetical protein